MLRSILTTVLFFTFGAAALAQNAPRVAMDSFLNQRFYPKSEKGRFMVDRLAIIFPPATSTKGRVVLTKAGKTVSFVPVVSEVYPENDLKAFGQVVPDIGANRFMDADGPGDYTMSLELAGKVIGSYSFRLEQGSTADPFAAKAPFQRSGPWSKTAIVTNPIQNPDEPMRVWVWLCKRDLPGYNPTATTPYNVVLLRAGKEIAFGPMAVVSEDDWEPVRVELLQNTPAMRSAAFKYSDLVKTPGDYSLGVKVRGAIAKEFKFRVANGSVVRLAQNDLKYTGEDALSPQGVYGSRRLEQFWTAPIR